MTRTNAKPFSEVSRLMLADGTALSRSLVEALIERHEKHAATRLRLLWSYYRNQMDAGPAVGHGGRAYRLAQERGLPSRVVGTWDKRGIAARFAGDDRSWSRKEVVVENDIAWRIQTMVDFMFGRPIVIASAAGDPAMRQRIERVLAAVWESSGGIGLFQDMALLGHVYGGVDLVVRAADQSRAAQAAGIGFEDEGKTPGLAPSGSDDVQGATPRGSSGTRRRSSPARPPTCGWS